ncbi:MAG: hypothetical protein JKY60_12670 [Kordiimonadaceae bacterium]|nr:hypothetical protein [Kordiimonadaceae bacterium]
MNDKTSVKAQGEKRASLFKKARNTDGTTTGRPKKPATAMLSTKPDKFEALANSTKDTGQGDGNFSGNTSNDVAMRAIYRKRARLNIQLPAEVKRLATDLLLGPESLSWTAVVLEGLQLIGEKRGIKDLQDIPSWDVLNRNNR